MSKSTKLIERIDRTRERLSDTATNTLNHEWAGQAFPDIPHWVHAGRHPDGTVRFVGQADALDDVGAAFKTGCTPRIQESELPYPTDEDVKKLYGRALA